MDEGKQVEPNQARKTQESLFRFRVLLEPRGFLRIIEFFLAVLMFATTAGYSSSVVYNITCLNYEFEKKYEFGYPFNFKDYDEVCVPSNATGGMKVNAYPGGKASFFVAIGVLAMLYCIATLIWYVIFEVKFIRFDLIPAADLVLTATFALFFFLASCAWASGVSTVKYWTTFENIKTNFYKNVCSTPGTKCIGVTPASYASLNASILFGFLNFLVWLGNCWFVFKETTWFQARQKKQEPQTQAEPPPNDI